MKQLLYLVACISSAVLIAALSTGCHNYYKKLNVNPPYSSGAMKSIDSLKLQNRVFILRNGSNSYYMKDLQINPEYTTLSCTLDTLPYWHQFIRPNKVIYKHQYRVKDPLTSSILNEVHIYIPRDNTITQGTYSLKFNQVQRIEVIQKDKKRTTNSYVLGGIGYTIATAAVIGAIILATKSSCPFVSSYDGNQFTLQGETFGGAIYPQLARHDYLPLKMQPNAKGRLQLKISNELQERQYTDIANLMVITHSKQTTILADETGHLYSIGNIEAPHTAWLNNKQLNLSPLLQHNDEALQFMDDTTNKNGHNELQLQFHKPAGAVNAKLVLAVKNSYWLDYLYGELAKGFGRFYPIYIKQQNKRSPAELLRWVKEQQIPLTVSVKTNTGWKEMASLTTIGPVATREVVVPLQELPVEKELQVRLSSGFLFWEIDRVAIDYSPNEPFTIKEYAPVTAYDELNKNVLPLLQKEDGIYCEQPVPGNIATLTYEHVPVNDASLTQTFILHTKGYYTHVRHFKGGMNKAFLQQFKQRDAFSSFSKQCYQQLSQPQLAALSLN